MRRILHEDETLPILPQEQYLLGKEFGPMLNQERKLIHIFRHGRLHRESDGAIEFLRIKDDLQKHFLYCHHWSDDKWKKTMAGGGGAERRFQYCTDDSGIIVYFRALQGHSGRNLKPRTSGKAITTKPCD